MWARFRHYFKGFPAQEKVAQLMVMYGLRVHEGNVYAGDVKLSDTAMARAAGVDRRGGSAPAATTHKKAQPPFFFVPLLAGFHLRANAPPLHRGAPHNPPSPAAPPPRPAG